MDEHEARALLTAVPAPPSRVQVDTVLHEGRRRVRARRRAGATGGAVVALAVLLGVPAAIGAVRTQPPGVSAGPVITSTPESAPSGPAGPPPVVACPISVLPIPDGRNNVEVTVVDPTGRYIGGHDVIGQNFVPILWTDGVPRVLPIQADSADISAINKDGVVVGLASTGTDEYVFHYQAGNVTRLRSVPGYPHVFPEPAINAAGDVVINAEAADAAEGAGSIAIIWKAGTTTATKLPLPAGANVFAVSDDGARLIGTTYVNSLADNAYQWSRDGHGAKLATPAGQHAVAYAARGDWAAGGVFAEAGTPGRAARWDLRTGNVTVFDEGGNGLKVNASGWVVTDTQVIGDSGPLPLAGQNSHPVAVSDTGLVVGAWTDYSGKRQPVTWRC
jgi:hypothetical protein